MAMEVFEYYMDLDQALATAVGNQHLNIPISEIVDDDEVLKELAANKMRVVGDLKRIDVSSNVSLRSIYVLTQVISSRLSTPDLHFSFDQIIGKVPEKLRNIMIERYGLLREPETLAVIGEQMGVTRERIRQLANKGVEHFARYTSLLDLELVSYLENAAKVQKSINEMEPISEVYKTQASIALLCVAAENIDMTIYHDDRLTTDFLIKRNTSSKMDKAVDQAEKVLLTHESSVEIAELAKYTNLSTDVITHFNNVVMRDGAILHNHNKHLTVGGRIIDALRAAGGPLTIAQIAKKTGFTLEQVRGVVGRKYTELVNIGPGTYALTEWGYSPGFSADVAYRFLKESGEPRTVADTVAYVGRQRVVKGGSIKAAIVSDSRIYSPLQGYYALTEWDTSNS
jgi:hypothetical protein